MVYCLGENSKARKYAHVQHRHNHHRPNNMVSAGLRATNALRRAERARCVKGWRLQQVCLHTHHFICVDSAQYLVGGKFKFYFQEVLRILGGEGGRYFPTYRYRGLTMSTEIYFCTVLKIVILRSRCQHGQFLVRTSWPADGCLLTMPSCALSLLCEHLYIHSPPFLLLPTRLPILWTRILFSLIQPHYLFMGPMSKHSHTRIRGSTYELRGTIQLTGDSYRSSTIGGKRNKISVIRH